MGQQDDNNDHTLSHHCISSETVIYNYCVLGRLANLSSREYILKAARYADRTTEMEQMFIRSQVAYLSGNPEGCVKALKELVERYPNERLSWEYLGITSLEMGRTEESIQYLNRVAELNPTAGIIYSDLAYAY